MKKLILSMVFIIITSLLFAKNSIINGDNYTVTLGAKGGIESLVVNGQEFVEDTYFNGPDDRPQGEFIREDNKLTVKTPLGVAFYEFLPDRIELVVENISAYNYFLVFKSDVRLMVGDYFPRYPYCFAGKPIKMVKGEGALSFSGDFRIWAPWEGDCPALDCFFNLKPRRIKETITPVKLSLEEINVINHIEPSVKIFSPMDYQVFQRQSKKEGFIVFSGKVNSNISNLKYRIEGLDLYDKKVDTGWKSLKVDSYGVFSERIKHRAGGWYKIQIKYNEKEEENIKVIEHVGVGEVIIGAGQSNSTNCGQFPTKQTSGMVSSTDGQIWAYGDDPQLGAHDGSGGGSFYPSLGDALYEEFHVPIGVSLTGHAGSSIEAWQPNTAITGNENLYTWLMERVLFFGREGFRCVLWHQGEANVFSPMENSYKGMVNLIESSRRQAGFEIPWFVAKVSYLGPENSKYENIREAQQKLWDESVAFEGPDTDVLTGAYRDYDGLGVHLSLKGLKKHGEMWAEKIIPYIHSQID